MKFFLPLLPYLFWMILCSGCSNLYRSKVDNRDFAVYTYPLGAPVMERAAKRAQRFWAKHAARYGTEPGLLAVEAYMVDTGVLGVPFSAAIDHSETTASSSQHGIQNDAQSVTCVMIFDTKTGQLYNSIGYVFVDTPSIGTVIHVQKLTARYIGRGA